MGANLILFTLRYRRGNAGVITCFIEAEDDQQAGQIGQAYCDSLMGSRFIKVERAVVAGPSILNGGLSYSDQDRAEQDEKNREQLVNPSGGKTPPTAKAANAK